MDKRNLHHLLTSIRKVKLWYLIVPFLVCATVSIVALRNNNLGMLKLRETVYTADQSGGNVEGALQNLRSYVYSHMNTNLSTGNTSVYPPIQLKYTYQRLTQAEQDRVNKANSQIYTDAQHYCEAQDPTGFSGRGRVPCIEDYVSNHGTKPQNIPAAMYKFDFISPTWSPDLAGFSLLLSAALLLALIVRLAAAWFLKQLTR